MLKRLTILAFALWLLLSPVAIAEVTNRDMQLTGGIAVSSSSESFFFAPMEPGVARRWGLYKASTCNEGPIFETTSGIPARLLHADMSDVYFWGYTDADRTVQSLYSVSVSGGTPNELLSGVSAAFVEDNTSFLYVKAEDPYTLYRYDTKEQKSTKIKDMVQSNKKIIDAVVSGGELYFLTADANGREDGYKLNKSSGKANNLDKGNPAAVHNLLYENFRIYATDSQRSRIYSMSIEGKKGVPLGGDKYPVSLSNPRFGSYLYSYDAEGHRLIGCALDGSGDVALNLDGTTLTNIIMGGSADEVYFYCSSAIYSAPANLSSSTRLFSFDTTMGGMNWTHITPVGDNILVTGYSAETMMHAATMPPTGVYLFTRGGELLFSYPQYDPEAEAASAGEAVTATGETPQIPDGIGNVPVEPKEEGETYFVF